MFLCGARSLWTSTGTMVSCHFVRIQVVGCLKENSRNDAKEKCLGYILLAKEGPDQNSPPPKK